MPSPEDKARDVILLAYDAALGRTSWTTALAAIADLFMATGITLLAQNVRGSRATVLGASGFESVALRNYEQYYRARNVILASGQHLLLPGVVRTTEMMVPEQTLLKSEYYNDFLQPLDVRHHLSTTLQREGDDAVHLTFFRPKSAGVDQSEEMRLLQHVVPHLERALQIHQRLAVAEQHAQGMTQAVERSGRGVALLDRSGRVIFVNSSLEKMIGTSDGLMLNKAGFASTAREATRRLQAAIAEALRGGSGGSLAIPRTTGAAPYAVVVSAVPAPHRELLFSDAAVIIIVSDPSSAPAVDLKVLRETFGLTPAEARLASRLANGRTIQATAAELRISVMTARTHLKRVLQKTDTHRQSELVRVLLLAALP